MRSNSSLFQTLVHVATAQPRLFDRHRDDLIHYITKEQNFQACQCFQQYCVASVILGDESTADEYLTLLIELIKNNSSMSTPVKSQIFYTCQVIGARHKQSLANKRRRIAPPRGESNVPNVARYYRWE